MQRPVAPPAAIDYPTSDGKRLAENDPQLHAIHYAFGALRMRYDDRSASRHRRVPDRGAGGASARDASLIAWIPYRAP